MEFEARKALDQKPAPECFEIEMECALYKAEVVVKYSVSLEFIITLFAILDSIPDFVYTRAACLKLRKNYRVLRKINIDTAATSRITAIARKMNEIPAPWKDR